MSLNDSALVNIDLRKLNYSFIEKPILVSGRAMEYYGLRKAGDDIDLIATEQDIVNLIKIYPSCVKNLWEDIGVCPFEFEIWKTINFIDYDELRGDAIEKEELLRGIEDITYIQKTGQSIIGS